MRLSIVIEGGRELLTPLYETDDVMFKHCSGGLSAVTREFLKELVPLLEAHGVRNIEIPLMAGRGK